ncbi:MAG: D-alanine--D-alanine ligase family protein [bacterium]
MKLGFTYDLKDDYLKAGFSAEEVAEFDTIETIEGIEKTLTKLGYSVDRIGAAKSLISRVVAGERWDIVFNIAEGIKGVGREAQIPAILDIYEIPYVFSEPMVLSLTLHKAMAKRIVRDAKIKTPDFHVVYSPDDIKNIQIPYPLFVKPLSEGTGKGIDAASMINSQYDLEKTVLLMLKKYCQPVLVEKFLPGREFTVGITGTGDEAKVVGVIEVNFLKEAQSNIYGLVSKKNYEKMVHYTVPEKEIFDKCADTALACWKVLECRDGGRVDLRNNEKGEPEFIEVNPLAGLNPIDSDLPILARMSGLSYDGLIKEIIDSATKRIFHEKTGLP